MKSINKRKSVISSVLGAIKILSPSYGLLIETIAFDRYNSSTVTNKMWLVYKVLTLSSSLLFLSATKLAI